MVKNESSEISTTVTLQSAKHRALLTRVLRLYAQTLPRYRHVEYVAVWVCDLTMVTIDAGFSCERGRKALVVTYSESW